MAQLRGSNEFTLIMFEKHPRLWAFDPASQCRISISDLVEGNPSASVVSI